MKKIIKKTKILSLAFGLTKKDLRLMADELGRLANEGPLGHSAIEFTGKKVFYPHVDGVKIVFFKQLSHEER